MMLCSLWCFISVFLTDTFGIVSVNMKVEMFQYIRNLFIISFEELISGFAENNNDGGIMHLKSKLMFIIAISFIIFYLGVVIGVDTLIRDSSEKYFREMVTEKKESIQKILDGEFLSLSESYYMYIYNIPPETIIAAHKYTAIVLFSSEGEVLDVITDRYSESIFEVSSAENLSPIAKTERDVVKGFFYYNDKMYMFTSFPSYRTGKYPGYVAVVREIDRTFLQEIKSILKVDFIELTDDQKEKEGEVSGFLPLLTPDGKVVGYLKIGYINRINPLVVKIYYWGLVLSGLILFVSISLASYLIDRTMLRRLTFISNFMKNIGKRGFRTGERIMVVGEDELMELASSINLALDEIERNEKEISKMAENLKIINRILRHDILNDLAVIRGYAEVTEEKIGHEFCRKIMNRVDKAVETIEKLKNIEMVLGEAEFYPVRISDVVESIMGSYNIGWGIEGDGVVFADDGLYSIIDNLVSNAIKHGKSSRIKFEVRKDGENVVIRVIDDGVGIPEEYKSRLFEEGFSLGESSGLGLYIVKKLVEKYGGGIAVSDNIPSGAIFTIKLKRATDDMGSDEN